MLADPGPWSALGMATRRDTSAAGKPRLAHRPAAPRLGFWARAEPGAAARVAYVGALLSACAATAWLVARLRRAGESELLRLRAWLIATTAALGVLCFFDLPYLSNDLYLYLAHGDMLERQGFSPYVAIPQRHFPPDALAGIPWTAQTSAYGPAALLMFRAASALGGGGGGRLLASQDSSWSCLGSPRSCSRVRARSLSSSPSELMALAWASG